MKKKIKKKRVVTKKKNSPKKKAKPKSVETQQQETASFQRGPAPRDTTKGHLGGGAKAVRMQKHQSR